MTTPSSPELVQVHVLELPVPIAAKTQQHFEELLREFSLMQAGAAADVESGDDERHVPRRLMALVDTLTQAFAGMNDDARSRLNAAIARGDAQIDDHLMELPREAGPGAQALLDMLEEADEYCRRGEHLLTLSTPQDCIDYRRWYLAEVVGQLAGQPPVPWSQYRRQA